LPCYWVVSDYLSALRPLCTIQKDGAGNWRL
jgi:hypothetical protein